MAPMPLFPGILKKPSGELYYKPNSIKMVEVPIGQCDGDFPLTHASDITGEIAVYTPIEWVPVVRLLETIPAGVFKSKITEKTTIIRKSELYGKFATTFTLGDEAGLKGLKMEFSETSKLVAKYSCSNEVKQRILTTAELGHIAINKIVMSMSLRVKRVYEHTVHLHLNGLGFGDSLTWKDHDNEEIRH
ncbi:hypothetical protein BG000_005815 [Podila horticola]|nr:hypothetical protein BG000_005815 [Podila horticola]